MELKGGFDRPQWSPFWEVWSIWKLLKSSGSALTMTFQYQTWYLDSVRMKDSSKATLNKMNGPQRTACLAKGYTNEQPWEYTFTISVRCWNTDRHRRNTDGTQTDNYQILRLASTFARQQVQRHFSSITVPHPYTWKTCFATPDSHSWGIQTATELFLNLPGTLLENSRIKHDK